MWYIIYNKIYLYVEGREGLSPSLYISKHNFLFLVGTAVQKVSITLEIQTSSSFCP